MFRDADQRREVAGGQSTASSGVEDGQALFGYEAGLGGRLPSEGRSRLRPGGPRPLRSQRGDERRCGGKPAIPAKPPVGAPANPAGKSEQGSVGKKPARLQKKVANRSVLTL